ncbi:MAG: hypothetical protein QGG14_02035, partial [Planctomycetota bacterium]|nr:hypothetical protein [Planctomycetota bacterium]
GGKQISISPGKSTDSNEKPLIGKAPPHPLKALGDLFSGEDDKKSLGKMLQNFGDLAEDLLTGKGTIGGAIGSARTAFERVGAAAEEVRIAVADARKGTGNLGWVVKKAGDFLASADDVAKAVRSGEGLASRLLSNRTLADNVEKSMQNLRTVTDELAAGRGPLGRLLRDPAMEKEIQLIVRNLNEAMTALNEGKGLAQALLHDQSLRDNARSIVSDLRGVANDLELGKGTIGRLIKDETVYLQIERLLNQVSRVIEDQREAAPVSTFFNIFTGAFQ